MKKVKYIATRQATVALVVMMILLAYFLFSGRKSAAYYCQEADEAKGKYESMLSNNDTERSSGEYLTVEERESMQRREAASAQSVLTLENVCSDQRRFEEEEIEIRELEMRFDARRFGCTLQNKKWLSILQWVNLRRFRIQAHSTVSLFY